jgi:uncharacterized phiE125 gp8 family phage protein
MGYGGYLGYSGPPIITENVRNTQIYSYEVVSGPNNLPVTLEQVKEQLKIDYDTDDDLLTLYIEAATDLFQSYTNRILINTTFKTYFDCFRQSFELARSKLQSLVAFQYLVNGVFTDVDSSIYYVTNEVLYSRVYIPDPENFPTDKDDLYQSISIEFVAGYGDDSTDVPADIQSALLQVVADLYENRGDCSDCSCSDVMSLPSYARMIYNKYRIMTAFGSPYRG